MLVNFVDFILFEQFRLKTFVVLLSFRANNLFLLRSWVMFLTTYFHVMLIRVLSLFGRQTSFKFSNVVLSAFAFFDIHVLFAPLNNRLNKLFGLFLQFVRGSRLLLLSIWLLIIGYDLWLLNRLRVELMSHLCCLNVPCTILNFDHDLRIVRTVWKFKIFQKFKTFNYPSYSYESFFLIYFLGKIDFVFYKVPKKLEILQFYFQGNHVVNFVTFLSIWPPWNFFDSKRLENKPQKTKQSRF